MSDEEDDFDALLDAAVKERSSEPNTEQVEILLGKKLVTLRFTELSSIEWANITSASPARLNAPLDVRYGYNVHTATEAAASKSGVRIDGDVEKELSDAAWKKLFKAIETPARGAITDAIWVLNEFAPAERLASAKKGSAVDSKPKPSSPAN